MGTWLVSGVGIGMALAGIVGRRLRPADVYFLWVGWFGVALMIGATLARI